MSSAFLKSENPREIGGWMLLPTNQRLSPVSSFAPLVMVGHPTLRTTGEYPLDTF